jgi:4-amino-4-deoxy-L-arabinose transferase-like glycosyltransferase
MIRLVAAAMQWTGRNDESAGARISFAASIGSLFVVALIGTRFLPDWAGLAAMLFYSVFPAELAIARRTWTDALVEFAGLLLIWCACEVSRGRVRRVWYSIFALVGSLGILVKESMPVQYGLCALWILWILVRRREWTNAAILISATIAGMAISLWWLAHQVGSLADYVGIVMGIPRENAANAYALEYASGPAYLLLYAFWIATPMTSLFSLAGLVALGRGHKGISGRALPLTGMACYSAVFILIAMAMPHWLNLRYAGAVFGPFCILAGLGCWFLITSGWKWLDTEDRRVFAAVAAVIVMGGATADYLRFQRFFVRDQTVDLSIKMLIDEHNQ